MQRWGMLLLLLGIFTFNSAQAEETDQYTLPPYELYDLGPFASYKLTEVLKQVVAQTNAEMRMYAADRRSHHAANQLARRRKDTYIADLFYKYSGPGFPRWLRWHQLPAQAHPLWFKESIPWKTVYWLVFSYSPLFAIGLTPTINMYGYHFGTDKLGHFFMQGHSYFKIYTYFLDHGYSTTKAHDLMILYGQVLEQTYLGTLINGIYSNADLAANYSGWKFYLNLAHPINIGNRSLPPILALKADHWELVRPINKDFLKPYLSDNLNEAWNPCNYMFSRSQIRRQIQNRCQSWVKQEGITKSLVAAKLQETSRWHKEEYGHWLPASSAVTLATCFENLADS